METEGKSRYQCIAHGCRMYATIDSVCWWHDNTPGVEWAAVTAGMHNHEGAIKYVGLILTSDGRERLEAKFGSLEQAAAKAAESLNDQDLMPKDSDYLTERRNLDGTLTSLMQFSWYAYGSRVRRHLLAVFKKKKEVTYWFQEAA